MWRLYLVMTVACSGATETTCKPPPKTTYSCQPSSGSAGPRDCTGGPTWSPTHATTDALHQDDPGTVFPDGCKAVIPDCNPFFKGEARTFYCTGGAWAEPT